MLEKLKIYKKRLNLLYKNIKLYNDKNLIMNKENLVKKLNFNDDFIYIWQSKNLDYNSGEYFDLNNNYLIFINYYINDKNQKIYKVFLNKVSKFFEVWETDKFNKFGIYYINKINEIEMGKYNIYWLENVINASNNNNKKQIMCNINTNLLFNEIQDVNKNIKNNY